MWGIRGNRRIWLILLALLAFGLRAWVAFALSTEHPPTPTPEANQIAENLLAGRGFSMEFLGADGPTSQQAPFYPFLLAAAYACFGVGSAKAILAVQLLQCLAGTGLVLAVVWLAWSLVPNQPELGWIAGLVAAVYPAHLQMAAQPQAAIWAALFLTLLLAVVVSPRWRATRGGAILAGTLSGILLLVEPILALALPICAAVFWLAEPRRRAPAAFGRALLMAGVAAVVIAPWIVRNRAVHGEFVFIKSTFGYAFWQGNNPESWGTDTIPNSAAEPTSDDCAASASLHETRRVDEVALEPADYRQLGRLSEPERSRELGRWAWQSLGDAPGRYAHLCLQRLRYFLLFDPTNPTPADRLDQIATTAWLVLIFIGALVSRAHWSRLWPTFAIFAVVTAFHALVLTSARFRVPLEPMTFVWAASAISPLIAGRMGRSRIRIHRPGECPRDPFEAEHVLRGPHYKVEPSSARRRAG